MKNELITNADPKSPVSEMFRTLRTNLQYINKKSGAQTILLTSTIQGEGKSFVAGNLAIAYAQAGKNVLLVDSDMRRPRQHKLFSIDMYPGLSNYLSGVNFYRDNKQIDISECIYKSDVENLSILPAGNIPPNPSELLQSEKLIELNDKITKMFDVIIYDGAPCLIVTDATIVSRIVDATILVTSYKKTKVEDLKEVKARINRVGGNVVGVVLNRVRVTGKKYNDKYYYTSVNTEEKKIGKHIHDDKEEYSYHKDENDVIKKITGRMSKISDELKYKMTSKENKPSKKKNEKDDLNLDIKNAKENKTVKENDKPNKHEKIEKKHHNYKSENSELNYNDDKGERFKRSHKNERDEKFDRDYKNNKTTRNERNYNDEKNEKHERERNYERTSRFEEKNKHERNYNFEKRERTEDFTNSDIKRKDDKIKNEEKTKNIQKIANRENTQKTENINSKYSEKHGRNTDTITTSTEKAVHSEKNKMKAENTATRESVRNYSNDAKEKNADYQITDNSSKIQSIIDEINNLKRNRKND